MNIPKLEREIGIEVYATRSKGVGGRLRQFPEDFQVEEILTDGSKATIIHVKTRTFTGRGRYLICALVKRNWDTLLAVKTIAGHLNMSQERIRIAGIKDAKAVTAQHISIGRTTPEQISRFKMNDIHLYPLYFSNEKIHSNMLFGNQFQICIRAVSHGSLQIQERMQNVKDELDELGGIPNFFGHQRFGTARPITHIVGKYIVLGNWKKAALAYLAKPGEHEHPESRQARERLWNTQNFREALSEFPAQLRHERVMLHHLAKRSRDFIGAFHRLPLKLNQLFVQGYQSFLFNSFLSQRMTRGIPITKVQAGDYAVKTDADKRVALPLPGVRQSTSGGEQGEIEREILKNEGVRPADFHISRMPKISATGGLRIALSPIGDFSLAEPTADLANPGKRKVSVDFTLGKGSYATVVLREFMKPRDPRRAGF